MKKLGRVLRVFFPLSLIFFSTILQVQSAPKKRILVVTHTEGFRHSSIPVGEEVVRTLGERNRLWEVDYCRTAEDVRRMITAENLKKYDAVMFLNTTGELPISEENKQAFLDWLKKGKGFIGVHAATDTFYKWPEYGKLIGGYFDGHPWHQKIRVKVEDQKHPSTQGLGPSFEITDEIYQFRDWSRQDKKVLLSVDNSSIDVSRGKRSDQDYAISWCRSYGKGRVFYTSLGHREDVWTNPLYQKHLEGGIKWVLRLKG